jgi:3',5'-cyclic AMP phosphodiesterase CpdA
VRVRGPIVFIGVCSARPTGLLHATGTIGADQLTKLERILRRFSDSALCCVVLIHHPPTNAGLSARRRLTDAAAFRAVLAETGADLVLHGHLHKTAIASQPGPHGPIPIVGARSASDIGRRPDRAAQYHLYSIERPEHRQRAQRFSITMVTRCYDAAQGSFQFGEELRLSRSFA